VAAAAADEMEGVMILARMVFRAKFGKGGELARQMAAGDRPPASSGGGSSPT